MEKNKEIREGDEYYKPVLFDSHSMVILDPSSGVCFHPATEWKINIDKIMKRYDIDINDFYLIKIDIMFYHHAAVPGFQQIEAEWKQARCLGKRALIFNLSPVENSCEDGSLPALKRLLEEEYSKKAEFRGRLQYIVGRLNSKKYPVPSWPELLENKWSIENVRYALFKFGIETSAASLGVKVVRILSPDSPEYFTLLGKMAASSKQESRKLVGEWNRSGIPLPVGQGRAYNGDTDRWTTGHVNLMLRVFKRPL